MERYERMRQFSRVITEKNSPKSVSIDITNRCNLKCKHCLNESGDSDKHCFDSELSDEEILKIADEIIEIHPEQCCICGGEPLLRKDLIYKLVHKLTSAGIITNMVTNGLLLNEEVAHSLKESGIGNVQISLDGLGIEHNIFRNMHFAFERSINALQILLRNEINATVSFCPNTYNFRNIRTYVYYLYNLGCRHIRTMPLLLLGRAKTNASILELNDEEQHNFINELAILQSELNDMRIEWGDPLEHIFLTIENVRIPMIGFGISSTGNYYFSPYIPLTFGSIKDYDVVEFWKKFKYIRKNDKFQNLMKDCYNLQFFNQFTNKYGEVNLLLDQNDER